MDDLSNANKVEVMDDESMGENFSTSEDYWDLKRFLELKQTMSRVFNNPKRAEALRGYIKSKNQIKDDMKNIAEDDSYAKGLGLMKS